MSKVIKIKEDDTVFIVVLSNNILISNLEFTKNEAGKDEVVLVKPFIVDGMSLSPYLSEYTNQNMFYISPSKIITLASPKPELQEKYLKLIAE